MNIEGMFRIIFIITFSPKYEYSNASVSEDTIHYWTNSNGELIGVWKEDFGHLFGFNLLKYYPDISFEVWRTDYRADRVYEHTFENGLIHRSFPETTVKIQKGFVKKSFPYAPLMEQYLEDIITDRNSRTLVMIPATHNAFSIRLLEKFKRKIPFLGFHLTNNNQLFVNIPQTINPVKYLHYKLFSIQTKNRLRKFNCISLAHWERLDDLKKRYRFNVRFNQFGDDSERWEADLTKEQARNELNLNSKRILLFSSRLVPEYQVDKVLMTLEKFSGADFLCIFTSRGPVEYTQHLNELVTKLKLEKNILFTGYVSEGDLKKYLTACDVFCTTAIQSAGSGAGISAILLGKPVITTDSGLHAELLKKHQCGLIIPTQDYKKWGEVFSYVIETDKLNIELLDRQIITSLFSWEVCLENWMETFQDTIDNFNQSRKISMD
jgi:glycosyltransferase involved in cell wall biosynthesis